MRWAGQYAALKKPDVIVHLGDHWDMPSLSTYDKNKKCFEGRRYKADIAAGNLAMDMFMDPLYEAMEDDPWPLELHFLEGNHEFRMRRAMECQPELDGLLGLKDTNLAQHGWAVHPFLEVVDIDGVAFSHYFTSGVMGRPVTTARALLTKKLCSCVQGHIQTYETAMAYDAFGRKLTALFAGTFYQHDEEYLNPQGNRSAHHAIHMLHEVKDGEFAINTVTLDYLRERFG